MKVKKNLIAGMLAVILCAAFALGGMMVNAHAEEVSAPAKLDVKESIDRIQNELNEPIDIAVELCLYCMKTQIFIDGNKRASVIFANHFLISKGQGFLVIPADNVPEFKKLLVAYYEGRDTGEIRNFLKKTCWKNF